MNAIQARSQHAAPTELGSHAKDVLTINMALLAELAIRPVA